MLGEYGGWLEVLDIKNAIITHAKRIIGYVSIIDIHAINETHFLLGSTDGLFKVTKE
jgi:hypothetical protein